MTLVESAKSQRKMSKSPGMSAPQPRVARHPITIYPADYNKSQRHMTKTQMTREGSTTNKDR